ncbi:MAG: two-component sensor histidine kinase [Alphaproteobacteria bacterium HGW-Alphaproteobacteria-5]|nr:MAG: two-component sensor histidine kinase [Alphaproteobacteria bacterium HGW-Alphaproteobacteria-5]
MKRFRNLVSPSLTARLTRRMLTIVAASFLLLLAILEVQYLFERDSLRDRALAAQAADLAAHVNIGPDGRLRVDLPDALDEGYSRPDRQYIYLILDAEGRVLVGSHDIGAPLAPVPAPGEDPYFSHIDFAGRGSYYGITVRLAGSQPPLYLQVAQGSVHPDVLADSLVEEFLEESWVFLLVLALCIVAVTVWTVRQSLAPVRRLSFLARNIGPASLDRRLPEEDIPSEIVPLVQAVNGSLQRIEAGYRREREFTANAAHELRTPLAVLKANIETISSLDEVPQLIEELGDIERLVSQLLRLAQVDNLVLRPGEEADLHEVALSVAQQLSPAALAAGRSIELTGERGSVPVRGNSDFLALALRNLVENALVHSPRDTTVEVRVGADASLAVIDNGPGVPNADAVRIFERFVRIKPGAYNGAGLGLSIAQRIAAVHGGGIDVGREPGRGAVFTLRLPKKVAPPSA